MEMNFITVVSGLPRSGTSMMMRMLAQGGMPLLMDGERVADEDNPHGYFELEAVKKLDQDAAWLADAAGKAVKIIYIFLYQLPPEYQYRILFMRRGLEEVIASQKVMLDRRGQPQRLTDQQLIDRYEAQLHELDVWLRRQPNMMVQYVDYRETVADPGRTVREVKQFLAAPLDGAAMIRSVDASLHRNRATGAVAGA